MYIRYELYLDDEYQEIGFLRGMDDTGFSEDLASDLTFRMDRELTVPRDVFIEHCYTESWFTEAGAKKFEKDIQDIVDEYEYDGVFEVRKRVANKLENVVYEDENQVVVDIGKQYEKEKELTYLIRTTREEDGMER